MERIKELLSNTTNHTSNSTSEIAAPKAKYSYRAAGQFFRPGKGLRWSSAKLSLTLSNYSSFSDKGLLAALNKKPSVTHIKFVSCGKGNSDFLLHYIPEATRKISFVDSSVGRFLVSTNGKERFTLGELKSFTFQKCSIKPEQVPFEACPKLEALNLQECNGVTQETVKNLRKAGLKYIYASCLQEPLLVGNTWCFPNRTYRKGLSEAGIKIINEASHTTTEYSVSSVNAYDWKLLTCLANLRQLSWDSPMTTLSFPSLVKLPRQIKELKFTGWCLLSTPTGSIVPRLDWQSISLDKLTFWRIDELHETEGLSTATVNTLVLDDCRVLGDLKNIPSSIKTLKLAHCRFPGKCFGYSRRDGAQLRGLSFNHLKSLRRLVFDKSWLGALPSLSPNINSVVLTNCCFIDSFVFHDLFSIASLTISNCSGLFVFDLKEDCGLQKLSIIDSTDVTDASLKGMPANLASFRIQVADITNATIERLPRSLERLEVRDCPKVTIPSQRVALLLDNCEVVGIDKQPLETDKIRTALESRVFGQPQAIRAAFGPICSALGNLAPVGRPKAILLFTGPSGTGKTELAKTLALISKRKLLRYDMGEHTREFDVSRLIGSGRGYVDSDKGGKLVNDVIANPNAVVLFDEFEKAHALIHKALLAVFDAGRLTDAQGTTADFTNTIIILTSNLGSERIAQLAWKKNTNVALKQAKTIAIELVKQSVAPEFAGRIDAVVPFRPLPQATVENIVRHKVRQYTTLMKSKHDLTLHIAENVWKPLSRHLDPELGVRPAVRTLEATLNSKLSEGLLNGIFQEGDTIYVDRSVEGELQLDLRPIDRRTKGKGKEQT